MKYKITLHGRVINVFETFKAADDWVRAYKRLNHGTANGAVIRHPQKEAA